MDGETEKKEDLLKDEIEKPEDKATDSKEETKEEKPKAEPETKETKEDNKQDAKDSKEDKAEPEKPKVKETIKEDSISAADYKKLVDDYSDSKSKAEKLEGAVKAILDSKLAAIPDELKDIVPEVDDLAKLAWIEKAESKGLFTKKESPEVEIGSKLKVEQPKTNKDEKLTPQQKLSNYFSNVYK